MATHKPTDGAKIVKGGMPDAEDVPEDQPHGGPERPNDNEDIGIPDVAPPE